MAAAAISVRGLRVTRGSREVLRGIGCTVDRGVVCGLLGPSGSGKTTLMRAVVGVQRAVRGQVEVLGQPAGAPGLRSRVGYLTQRPAVYGELTVRANLSYVAALLGVGPARLAEVLEQVALSAVATERVARLSGGQQARVSLAIALLGSPELLVLDEPTVGLDPVLRRDLWQLFRSLAQQGTTLLVSSHVMDEAARCDRLLLLRDGRLVADDSLPALLARTGTVDAESAFLALVTGPTGIPA